MSRIIWGVLTIGAMILVVFLLLILAPASHAQGVATMEWQGPAGGSGGGGAITTIGTGLLAAKGLTSPYAQMNARARLRMATQATAVVQRPETLSPDSHAVVKHGQDAVGAWADTASTSDPHVHEARCADGRIRRWNDVNNAFSVMGPDGSPITSFYYGNSHSLNRALTRDGCVTPTREAWRKSAGHDNVRQIPGRPYVVTTTEAGPVATGTRTPYQKMVAEAQAKRLAASQARSEK